MEISCSFREKAELKLELYPIPSLKIDIEPSEQHSVQHTSSSKGPKRSVLHSDEVGEKLASSLSTNESAGCKHFGQNEIKDRPNKNVVADELKNDDQENPTVLVGSISINNLMRNCGTDLDAIEITCLAATSKGPRCKYRIAKSNLKEAQALLESWRNGEIAEKLEARVGQFEQLASLLLCRRYHQKDASSLARAWEVMRDPTIRQDQEEKPLVPSSTARRTRSSSSTIVQWDEFDSSQVHIRKFEPFDARAKSRTCTQGFVQGAMKKNLNATEAQSQGLVYIYWFPGNFGHIKIGVTSKSPEERLAAWRTQCGHEPLLIYPREEKDREPIPHVFRVEKLVQAQLRNCRRKQTLCRKCKKRHHEWFETATAEAIATVQRWTAWIRTEPYEQTPDGGWSLKREEMKNIQTTSATPVKVSELRPSAPRSRDRSRRLSASPRPRRQTRSEDPPRRSQRLAEKSRSVGTASIDSSTFDAPLKFDIK
ncbi:MAG: hypothetical protein Q9222_002508 [Ikaeria aurantiellina]